MLGRALEIQNSHYKEQGQSDRCYVETYKLTANCHLKMKNYKKAHEFIRTALDYVQASKGEKSK